MQGQRLGHVDGAVSLKPDPLGGQRQTRLEQGEELVTVGTATQHPVGFALSLGLLGGGALITTTSLTHRGPVIYLPYAAIVLASAVFLRVERVRPFKKRFSMTLGAFMFATILLYLFIGIVQARTLLLIPLLGHAWRLGFMLLIGASLSAAVATLSATRESEPAAV